MPSPELLAEQGVKAVKDGQYKEGIEKLTEALRERPAPLWLLERSKAHLRTEAFAPALRDAERALRVAFDRANRDQMVEAQIRRAVTYYRLARYADADLCAFWALRLLDGARAFEDDGQARRLDDNGDYAVTVAEVTGSATGDKESRGKDGLAAAMSGGSEGRSKEVRWKNQAIMWRSQALSKLEKLPPGDPGRKISIKDKYPNPADANEEPLDVDDEEDVTAATDKPDSTTVSAPVKGGKAAWEELWNQYRTVHAKSDIRSSFYQTDTTLNVDIFVRNVPKEEFKVEAQQDSIVLGPIHNTNSGRIHIFLYGKIKPDETKYTVKSMKIELVLKKDTPVKWPTLRRKNSELIDNLALASFPQPSFSQFHNYVTGLGYSNPQDLNLKEPLGEQTEWYDDLLEKLRGGLSSAGDSSPPKASETAPLSSVSAPVPTVAQTASHNTEAHPVNENKKPAAYPTSSKTGPKNWDNLEGLDEEEGKDGAGGDVDSFFRSLYEKADPDTRRAMMKSYVESSGTSLSTSWDEAKDKTYTALPPDGSEAKQW